MSLILAPFGAIPAWHESGRPPTPHPFKAGIASGYATNIFTGDFVKLVTGGVFERTAVTEPISGVFAGCEYTLADGTRRVSPYWPASTVATNIVALIHTRVDDHAYYRIQAGGPVAMTARGDAADHVSGTGNVKSGWSTNSLNTTLAGAAASAQLKIIDLVNRPGNDWGDLFTEVLVIVNERNLGLTAGNAI